MNVCWNFGTLSQLCSSSKRNELLNSYASTLIPVSQSVNNSLLTHAIYHHQPTQLVKKSSSIFTTKDLGTRATFELYHDNVILKASFNEVLLYKYLTILFQRTSESPETLAKSQLAQMSMSFFKTYFFESRQFFLDKTNLLVADTLSYKMRTKFANFFLKSPFNINVTM